MKQVKKVYVDKRLSLRRDWWTRAAAGISNAASMEIIYKVMSVERKIQNTVGVEFDFDELASLVAREKLSDECYYNLLRDCGFEVQ